MGNYEIIKEGVKAARLCELSYQYDFDFRFLGFETHKLIRSNNTQCHIMSSATEVTIVFPGTNWTEWTDIKNDALARPDGIDDIWGEICDLLSQSDYAGKMINIFGHSLGGVYASECANRLSNVKLVMTFGQFKGYTKEERKHYTKDDVHYTFVNAADLASRYPFRRCNVDHLGLMIYLTRFDDYIIGQPLRFWAECNTPVMRVLDHKIENYVGRIHRIKLNMESK